MRILPVTVPALASRVLHKAQIRPQTHNAHMSAQDCTNTSTDFHNQTRLNAIASAGPMHLLAQLQLHVNTSRRGSCLYEHARTRALAHTHTHTYTHTQTQARTHERTQARTHERTHAHTHTRKIQFFCSRLRTKLCLRRNKRGETVRV